MKKFFICLVAIFLFFSQTPAFSGIESISSPSSSKAVNTKNYNKQLEKLYKEIPDLNDKKAVEKYIEKRLKITTIANIDPSEIHSPKSTNIVDANEMMQKAEQNTLSAYEKIYEQSLEKASQTGTLNENLELKGVFFRERQAPKPEKFVPDFPYVTIKLSEDREIMAPAEEHIAYLLTTIKIEPIGLISVTEEFVFVSNNQGFPNGFFRILPKYTYSRLGKRRRIDFTLDSVTINDTPYQYKVTEIGNHLHIEPKTPIDLPTGIYTYKFKYFIDRTFWTYSNYDEFYWDITGRTLKNVVGSANALIILPKGQTFLAQNAVASTKQGLNSRRVTINTLDENSLGFADTEALGVGEDIHLLITLDKNTLLPPSTTQKYLWFIQDFGAEFFAFLALLAIFFSYKISLKQIHKNQDKTRASIKKSPSIWRMLNKNIFDNRSFGGEILNLCSKNILELSENNDIVTLIKKTDNLSSLTKTEKTFLSHLFPDTSTTLTSTKESSLKLKRAYLHLKTTTNKEILIYKLKLNILYLAFSFAMLISGFIASSLLSINPSHTLLVILICSTLITPLVLLCVINIRKRYIALLIKLLSFLAILFIASWLSIYTSKFYAVLVILTIYVIFSYNKMFSLRSGLLRNKIKETENYKNFLQKNTELSVEARDFNSKAPYIYAFELEHMYAQSPIFTQITKLLNAKG